MVKKVFSDIDEYMHADHARTHESTAGTQDSVDPAAIDRHMRAIEAEGYTILPGLLSPADCKALRREVEPLLGQTGRNNFEGLKTQRIYSVLEKTRVCDALVEHPLVLGLLDRILEPNYLLSQLQVINLLPGEEPQMLHFDDSFYKVARPRRAFGAATIIAIDEFTTENGATRLLPGSHLWGEERPTPAQDAAAVQAVMPAGSALFFLGTLWHGGSANRSNAPRMCMTAQYCAPWCRPQENFSLSVSRKRAKESSEHIQRLLGYSIHAPLMGFVDGAHPKRLLED
jgi:hypothetical protein